MPSIFSTYSTGENRVTASFLAVIRSLSLDRIERILGALLEQSEFELVRFENQPSKGGSGVPDAIIQSSIRLLIETKTERNGVRLPQIERHIARLDQANETASLFMVQSPHPHTHCVPARDPHPCFRYRLRHVPTPVQNHSEPHGMQAACRGSRRQPFNGRNGDGRLVVRKSGTEPVVRIMAEGEDEGLVAEVVGDIVSAMHEAAQWQPK